MRHRDGDGGGRTGEAVQMDVLQLATTVIIFLCGMSESLPLISKEPVACMKSSLRLVKPDSLWEQGLLDPYPGTRNSLTCHPHSFDIILVINSF